MRRPEDALARAREEAERLKHEGVYAEEASGSGPPPAAPTGRLMEWAVIEPDVEEVRSVRPYGAPVTALKRGLVRLLMQYTGQLAAQQTRFNVNLLARVRQLEERIETLERERRGP